MKKTFLPILFIILLSTVASCTEKQSRNKEWIVLQLLDKEYKKYTHISRFNSGKFRLEKDQLVVRADYVVKYYPIVRTDSILDPATNTQIYSITLEDQTQYKISIVERKDDKPFIYLWTYFDEHNQEIESYYTTEIENKDIFVPPYGVPKDLSGITLLPTEYHSNKRWIVSAPLDNQIRITNTWIDINNVTDWSPYVIEVVPDYWKIKFEKWNDFVSLKRVTIDSTQLYVISISEKDRRKVRYNMDTLVATDIDEKLTKQNLTSLRIQSLRPTPPIYNYNLAYINNNYLREGRAGANSIENIEDYIKYKYPTLDRKTQRYNIDAQFKTYNGRAMIAKQSYIN